MHYIILLGKLDPKPKFNNVACPNENCKQYNLTAKGNVKDEKKSKFKKRGSEKQFGVLGSAQLVYSTNT